MIKVREDHGTLGAQVERGVLNSDKKLGSRKGWSTDDRPLWNMIGISRRLRGGSSVHFSYQCWVVVAARN